MTAFRECSLIVLTLILLISCTSVDDWYRYRKLLISLVHSRSRHQKPRRTLRRLTELVLVNGTAKLALIRYEFWVVFTLLGPAVRVENFYYFSVTLKHKILWLILLFIQRREQSQLPKCLFLFSNIPQTV